MLLLLGVPNSFQRRVIIICFINKDTQVWLPNSFAWDRTTYQWWNFTQAFCILGLYLNVYPLKTEENDKLLWMEIFFFQFAEGMWVLNELYMNCKIETLMYVYASLGSFWLVGWREWDHLQKLLQRASCAVEVRLWCLGENTAGAWKRGQRNCVLGKVHSPLLCCA